MKLWSIHWSYHRDGTKDHRLVLSSQSLWRYVIWWLFHHGICSPVPGRWNWSYRLDLICYELAHRDRTLVAEIPVPGRDPESWSSHGEEW